MTEEELKEQMRELDWGRILLSAGLEPYDTETSARNVARHCAKVIEKLSNEIISLHDSLQTLEACRPHWAKGFTSDSMAAQAYMTSTIEIWSFLGAENQTQAMQILNELFKESRALKTEDRT